MYQANFEMHQKITHTHDSIPGLDVECAATRCQDFALWFFMKNHVMVPEELPETLKHF